MSNTVDIRKRLVEELTALADVRYRIDENHGGVLPQRFRLFEIKPAPHPATMIARYATRQEADEAVAVRRAAWVNDTAARIMGEAS